MTARPPIRLTAQSAYLISNAQVTARDVSTTRRGDRASVVREMRDLIRDGLAVSVGPLHAVRPVQGNCTSPLRLAEKGGDRNRPHLDTIVRCRKCEACLKHKRAVWSARASHRIGLHPRTWMVTLTAAPAEHFILLCRAEAAYRRKYGNSPTWDPNEVFAARWNEFGKEVTKWLKRLRSGGAEFVYLQVVEAHKSGLPHVHLLIHEKSPVRYRDLTEQWKLGFSHAKLVEGPSAARYVTKYLVKSVLARVRASQDY